MIVTGETRLNLSTGRCKKDARRDVERAQLWTIIGQLVKPTHGPSPQGRGTQARGES
jgi:hypothetical protein